MKSASRFEGAVARSQVPMMLCLSRSRLRGPDVRATTPGSTTSSSRCKDSLLKGRRALAGLDLLSAADDDEAPVEALPDDVW